MSALIIRSNAAPFAIAIVRLVSVYFSVVPAVPGAVKSYTVPFVSSYNSTFSKRVEILSGEVASVFTN